MKWQKCFGVVVTDIPSTQSKSPITWSVSLFWASDNDNNYSFIRISSLDSSKNKWNGKYWINSREITTLTERSTITPCTKRANVSYWLQLLTLLSKVIIKMQSSSSNASFDITNGHRRLSLAVFFVIGFCHTFFTLAVMYKYFLFLFFFYLLPQNISRSLCVPSSLSYCPFILLFFFRHFNIMEPKELPSQPVSMHLRRSWHHLHKFRIEWSIPLYIYLEYL